MPLKDKQLFTVLAVAAEQSMKDSNSQELANAAWILVVTTVAYKDGQLLTVAATAAEQRMKRLNSQDLANTT